jgi:hypothetical protein
MMNARFSQSMPPVFSRISGICTDLIRESRNRIGYLGGQKNVSLG